MNADKVIRRMASSMSEHTVELELKLAIAAVEKEALEDEIGVLQEELEMLRQTQSAEPSE